MQLRRGEDPFLAAYLKCTKGSEENNRAGFSFSCKHVSEAIREDVIVKLAQVPAGFNYQREGKESK